MGFVSACLHVEGVQEFFTVGCTMLPKIYLKLQNLKSSLRQPFDRLNILFQRDFVQFPLVRSTLLYTINIKPVFL